MDIYTVTMRWNIRISFCSRMWRRLQLHWRWIRKHKSVLAKSMACTVYFSRFTAVTCCNPVLAPICTSTKFHFQFQWTPISKLSAVAHAVHEQSFARQLQTVSYELYDLNSEYSRCRCCCVKETWLGFKLIAAPWMRIYTW